MRHRRISRRRIEPRLVRLAAVHGLLHGVVDLQTGSLHQRVLLGVCRRRRQGRYSQAICILCAIALQNDDDNLSFRVIGSHHAPLVARAWGDVGLRYIADGMAQASGHRVGAAGIDDRAAAADASEASPCWPGRRDASLTAPPATIAGRRTTLLCSQAA